MRSRILVVFAAVALVAACETTDPSEDAGAGGTSGYGDSSGGAGAGAGGGGFGAPGSGVSSSALSPEARMQEIGDTVLFGYDAYTLDTTGRALVERQAAFLVANPSVTLSIEGHCDERGTREYNLALGDRRANAVRDYMVTLGIDPSRMRTISYGEERPAVAGSSEAEWAKNRRAVAVVTGGRLAS